MVSNSIFKDSMFQTVCCEPISLYNISVQNNVIDSAMIGFAVSSKTIKLSEFILPNKQIPLFKDAFYVIRCMLTYVGFKRLISIVQIESNYPEATKELHLALDKERFKSVMLSMSNDLIHYMIDYVIGKRN